MKNSMHIIAVAENCGHCKELKKDPAIMSDVKDGNALLVDITKNNFLFDRKDDLGITGTPTLLGLFKENEGSLLCNMENEANTCIELKDSLENIVKKLQETD